jgi:hypothetical protein
MTELQVILDFCCCACNDPLSVTVKCAGKGLALAGRSVARVHVPCPGCSTTLCVDFQPNGTIRGVYLHRAQQANLEPSVN